ADAMRALGFVEAQDRRMMMELGRRLAAGRLAEIGGGSDAGHPIVIGPFAGRSLLDVDRQARTLGLASRAAAGVEMLSAADRALHEAFAAGINAATALGAGRSVRLLGVEPEPWSVADDLMIAKLTALTYANQRWEEILAGGLIAEVGKDHLADF